MAQSYLPKYSLPQGLSAKTFVKIMKQVCRDYPYVEDDLPEEDRTFLDLDPENEAVRAIHFPRDTQQLVRSRNRLVFDEFSAF